MRYNIPFSQLRVQSESLPSGDKPGNETICLLSNTLDDNQRTSLSLLASFSERPEAICFCDPLLTFLGIEG